MATLMGSLLRRATRQKGEPLNIISFSTHERVQTQMAKANANFYFVQGDGIKTWNPTFAPLPKNCTLLHPALQSNQIPSDVNFDLVLSQNKFGQFDIAKQLSQSYHIPLLSYEHTMRYPDWPESHVQALKEKRGHINIFISEYSAQGWGWDLNDCEVLHHGIDKDLFKPGNEPRKKVVLSVVNDWINRDLPCGFKVWERVVKKGSPLPVHVVGDTPGLSSPAKSVDALAQEYRSAAVFLNTSQISPIPTSVLEAMASECAVVTSATCMLPEVIENGVNGFISNDENELRRYCDLLLHDEALAAKLGKAARQTILDRFSEDTYISKLNEIFLRASQIVYTGAY